ncbi:UNVERIFIED_CONTAM: hypothetical protein ABID98_004657 [Brevibacillus sp. OAP136]
MAWHGIAQAYTSQLNFPLAVLAYLTSLQIKPDQDHCLKQLLIVLADHFSYEEALLHVGKVYAIADGPTLAALVSTALQTNRAEFAFQLLASAEEAGMDANALSGLAQLVLSRLP